MASQSARRDFALLWTGQSISLFGDQFMVLALPLLAVTVLHTSVAQAALLPFALYLPFLLFGLPAGAFVDRVRRRSMMIGCDLVQTVAFLVIGVLALTGVLTFPLLLGLVLLAGAATVFFQVACTSYPPTLFSDPQELHKHNTQLYLSDSVSKTLGPMAGGPVIAFLGVVGAVLANAVSFAVSVLAVVLIRHREPRPDPTPRARGWLVRDVREGLAFVFANPILEPVILCGMTYTIFLGMVEAILVLYCKDVLGFGPVGIGIVAGAAAFGFPIGNLISVRLVAWQGTARTCVIGTVTSVTGLIAMPLFGGLGSAVGLVVASVVHCIGEGAFGPVSLTLRQTHTPAALLGRVNSVQRFLVWGMLPVGSLLASFSIANWGLEAAMWIGAVGTALCVPVLVRRGIRAGLRRDADRSDLTRV
ncbi:MFS transporter [Longispora sp. NPDC051575]|uniref:MFS transporter n=1 Tax=Longispora sp. NPDC051575 TaxID=3154943 RepID=UPI00343DE942